MMTFSTDAVFTSFVVIISLIILSSASPYVPYLKVSAVQGYNMLDFSNHSQTGAPATNYNIYRNDSSNPGPPVPILSTTATNITDGPLYGGVQYDYIIEAVNFQGKSNSTMVSGTPYGPMPDTTPGHLNPFTPDTFRTLLPDDAYLYPNSTTFVSAFVACYKANYNDVSVNSNQWTPTRYVVHGNTTTYVKVTLRSKYGSMMIPIPPGVVSDFTTSDSEMIVWDVDKNISYEFWQMQLVNGSWYTSTIASESTATGDGIYIRGVPTPTYNTVAASGLSYLAGQITAADLYAGVIDHRLMLALPWTATYHISPAQYNDGTTTGNTAIPEGALFRFPANLTMPTGLVPLAQMIFIAIQNYGFFICDTSGAAVFYVENQQAWIAAQQVEPLNKYLDNKPTYSIFEYFPWNNLEVVQWPISSPNVPIQTINPQSGPVSNSSGLSTKSTLLIEFFIAFRIWSRFITS